MVSTTDFLGGDRCDPCACVVKPVLVCYVASWVVVTTQCQKVNALGDVVDDKCAIKEHHDGVRQVGIVQIRRADLGLELIAEVTDPPKAEIEWQIVA